MANSERISTKEAARILGVGEQLLRVQIRNKKGKFHSIGFCERAEGGKNYVYYIYKARIKKLIEGDSF